MQGHSKAEGRAIEALAQRLVVRPVESAVINCRFKSLNATEATVESLLPRSWITLRVRELAEWMTVP